MRRFPQECRIVRRKTFGHVEIFNDTLPEEHLLPHTGTEIFPGEIGVVAVNHQFLLTAAFWHGPAPADVKRVDLLRQGRGERGREFKFRIGPKTPFIIRISEVKGVAHRQDFRAEFFCDGSVGVC